MALRSVFRPVPFKPFAVLKCFGEPARQIHEALVGPSVQVFPGVGGEKRRGRNVATSTANLAQDFVCELRFSDADRQGDPVPPTAKAKLHHSPMPDRTYGEAAWDAPRLTISGASASAYQEWRGDAPTGTVVFEFVDLPEGEVRLLRSDG